MGINIVKIPFSVKIGLAISILAIGITTFNVYLFYFKTSDMVYAQTVNRLSDIGRTGGFLLDEAQQESIKRFTLAFEENALSIPTQLLKNLPEGDSIEGLLPEVAAKYMASADFHTLAQTLRKIKAGTRHNVTPLGQKLERLSAEPTDPYRITYAYLLVKVPKFAKFDLVSFVADADYDEPDAETPIGMLLSPQAAILNAFQGQIQTEGPYTDQWGTFISTRIPVKDANGQVIAILGLDYDVASEVNQLNSLWNICMMILAVSVLLSLLLAYAIAHWLEQPIAKLRVGAQQLRDGNFDTSIEIKSRDEFGTLADTFNQMTIQLKRSFATLEEKNRELQRLDQLKDEFLANTSHELRTPLNGIIGIAESLIEGVVGELSEQVNTNLAMIATSGRRLSNLINDILDFSKLKHQTIDLQVKPVGVREIVDVVLTLSQPLIGNKSLQLVNAISPEIPAVEADENRLQQIFYNLIGNAVKFTEAGKIELSAKFINEQIEITVADTGIGIPADKLDRIFESFEQADGSTAREYGGTGLGLTVTQQLVGLHGGKIRVESVINEGSRFIFTLPVSEGKAASLSQVVPILSTVKTPELTDEIVEIKDETLNATASLTVDYHGDFNILAVDDEPVNLHVLKNYLSLQNYQIVQAASGSEALDFIENGLKPDAVLLDVMMPKMSGYEVARKLREKWNADEMPILMLTAKDQVDDLVLGLEAGANDYLTKPISKDELLARLKTHIRIKELQAAALRLAKENEDRLRQFLEAMPVGVQVLDAKGKPYYVNQRAQQLLGKNLADEATAEQITGHFYQVGTDQLYSPEDLPVVRALQGDSSSVDDLEVRQPEKSIPLEVWGTPIFDDQNNINYAIAAFADITERLKREKAERAREAAEAVNKMMMASIQYAKIIQTALLPNMEPVKTYLPNSFFLWEPKAIVGGDIIYAEAFEDSLIVAVIDCTGHGVPGAFMTMVASTNLRRITRDENCRDPADILKRLNFLVKTSLQQDTEHAKSDDGLDAAICWFKPKENVLLFAGAKLPLYHIHNEQISVITGDKQSLGYKKSKLDFTFTTHTIEIEAGMFFYMSTDGFLDQLGGPKRFSFGKKRFKQLLQDNCHNDFDEQSDKMLGAFKEYKGNNDRLDDVTVVGFGF
ncbi:MAG: hypothetical protein DRR19_19845 [Candidatus Parabeggiatoa sp. nov. 1]|nr:MAG: hypothetical protein DRR19_19845 [Gammaproteobacteria bacterium]